jgi:outer membrane immunogenic protein
MKKFLLATSAMVALTAASSAMAADLSRPVYKAPPPAPVYYSWTGFYIGAHVGGSWGTTESEINSIAIPAAGIALNGFVLPLSSHTNNGFIGGGQIGYNWQAGWAVFGAEVEVSAMDHKGKGPCLLILTCETKTDWMVTAAGRFGVTWDRALVYVKGGVAWADSDYSATLNLLGANLTASVSDTRLGALVGAGVEVAAGGGWSAKVEYNFVDFGKEQYNVPLAIGGVTIDVGTEIRQYIHTVKFGLNYRFGFDSVVAKY